jgi:preprotein translocase subunit SecG
MLQTILLIFHVIVAAALISFILLQQGKGATTGAAFGAGASATVFGARGAASFMSRTTAVLAIVFFANCLVLAFLGSHQKPAASLVDRIVAAPPAATAPASSAPAAPGEAPKATTETAKAPATAPDLPQIPASKP